MKLDLNFQITDLSGSPIEGETAGQRLARVLAGSPKGDALKFVDWARKLYAYEAIEVDRSDINILKAFVNGSEFITSLVKVEILNKIEELK